MPSIHRMEEYRLLHPPKGILCVHGNGRKSSNGQTRAVDRMHRSGPDKVSIAESCAVRAGAERGAATSKLHQEAVMNAVAMQSVISQRYQS